MVYVNREKINSGIVFILTKCEVSQKQAEIIADCMITADACGVHSHGLCLFPVYINKLKKGSFNLVSEPKIEKETSAFALIDSQNTIGMFSARFCMEYAVKKCQKSGIYFVFSKNSNTFGPAFYYTKFAAHQKKIGMCFSNSPATMPAWGGEKKILGTNPFSVAIPGNKKGPVLLDMATSIVAKSRINEIRKKGGQIPLGWAIDEFGNPTTDPVEAIKGMVLPMAGYKGYGIALIIDIVAGLMSGAGYLNHIHKFYSEKNECMNVGQCFVAINPELLHSKEFYDEIDHYIEEVHNSGENVLLPGEHKLESASNCEKYGLELTDEVAEIIKKVFSDYNVAERFEEV
ncbi:Ldh family oxidoreductase [Acetivibrio sp. MSJd-27]|uniref:Ldh family oxidoreductase n=1 Tax=Acetivibrio sp. MSJd-27 TaxID=2841523 RepID=UPI001C101622|nr:Ldh family oxidoreductase [Acetivibrio sp. MSJd-27]MBU5450134.1 Ldh family oxidoreductase [Acetivibrio sp. MSJd-27]